MNKMWKHAEYDTSTLHRLIKEEKITFAGNISLKIYGSLRCKSGKRIKRKNRVFFIDKDEAIQYGFRPCGHCMKNEYHEWKQTFHKKTTS